MLTKRQEDFDYRPLHGTELTRHKLQSEAACPPRPPSPLLPYLLRPKEKKKEYLQIETDTVNTGTGMVPEFVQGSPLIPNTSVQSWQRPVTPLPNNGQRLRLLVIDRIDAIDDESCFVRPLVNVSRNNDQFTHLRLCVLENFTNSFFKVSIVEHWHRPCL